MLTPSTQRHRGRRGPQRTAIFYFAAIAILLTIRATAADTILAQTKDQPVVQVVSSGDSENLSLALKIGDSALPIQSEGIAGSTAMHPDMPLKVESGSLGSSSALCINFGINDGKGNVRSFAIVAVKDTAGWRVSKIWTADSGPRGELGFTREKQGITFNAKSGIIRLVRTVVSDGVVHKLDCGCQNCGSLLTETSEYDELAWNAAAGKLERSRYERSYVVQPNENVLTVARKALGDARLMARVFKLNPEIKQDTALKAGQLLVVEKIEVSGKEGN